MLRLGNPARIDPAVRRFSLDALVDDEVRAKNDEHARAQDLLAENTAAIVALEALLREGEDDPAFGAIALAQARTSYKRAKYERAALLAAVTNTKVRRATACMHAHTFAPHGTPQEAVDERRHELQRRFLESAHIIACTLTGSGLEVLRSAALGINCVIVDEAAQCIEPEVLVPLQYGCRKVGGRRGRRVGVVRPGGSPSPARAVQFILVGDPQQLQATVFSQLAGSLGLKRPLFERLSDTFERWGCIRMLNIQVGHVGPSGACGQNRPGLTRFLHPRARSTACMRTFAASPASIFTAAAC